MLKLLVFKYQKLNRRAEKAICFVRQEVKPRWCRVCGSAKREERKVVLYEKG